MEDKNKLCLLDNNFSNFMTMHQPYANYPVYQTQHQQDYFAPAESNKPIYLDSSIEETTPSPPTKKVSRRGRTRNHYTAVQKEALEKAFLEEGIYVPIRKRDEMAKELNLSSKQVKIWYQNRRQKDKRRDNRRKSVVKVPMCADSPDSGVPEADDQQYQRNAVKTSNKSSKICNKTAVTTPPPVYSHLSNVPQYPIDYSQSYANYYNYDYLPAPPMFPPPPNDYAATNPYALHQYFQYMSGFASQYSSAAPADSSPLLAGALGQPMTTATTAVGEPQTSYSPY